MKRILLLCSSPTLSLRLSIFLGKKENVEFANYRDIQSALPQEAKKEYDIIIVVSFLQKFDLTARVSKIRETWTNAKVILITELENPKQQICRRTLVNGITYLFWHFETRDDIRMLIENFLEPELDNEIIYAKKRRNVKRPTIQLSHIERLKSPIVVIASSTGGFAALRDVIANLPEDFRAPIVIAQHMPKGFEETLLKSLRAVNPHLQIGVAKDTIIEARNVYVIPYDYHAEILPSPQRDKLVLRLNQGPQEHSLRPAADPLFRSVAKIRSHRVVAAILTGMGSDGTLGGKEIKKAGGLIICQDKESSAVWGMPRMAVESGICDTELPLSEIGEELYKLTK